MQNKTILITGSTDGIGRQTALDLANENAKVILHGRSIEKCEDAIEWINTKSKNVSLDYVVGDLASIQGTKQLAEEVKGKHPDLNVLLNNAGIYKKKRELTEDGYEVTFAVNHLSYFVLTLSLLDLLRSNAPSRVVNVSSMAHQRGEIDFENLNGEKHFSPYGAYALSKLANILFTKKLAELEKENGITVNCLHPGVINTKLLRKGFGFGGSKVEEGSRTSVYLALSDEVNDITGKYFVNSSIAEPSGVTDDKESIDKLWEISEDMTGIKYTDV